MKQKEETKDLEVQDTHKMNQYLVKTITHSTGEKFIDAQKVKENEEYTTVYANNSEEAKTMAKLPPEYRKLRSIQNLLG